MEVVEMAYALFLDRDRISEPFATKFEAWEFAEKRGLVKVVPSHDEDPPRRILALKYSIGVSSDKVAENTKAETLPSPVQAEPS
jgi:hypothetical protein